MLETGEERRGKRVRSEEGRGGLCCLLSVFFSTGMLIGEERGIDGGSKSDIDADSFLPKCFARSRRGVHVPYSPHGLGRASQRERDLAHPKSKRRWHGGGRHTILQSLDSIRVTWAAKPFLTVRVRVRVGVGVTSENRDDTINRTNLLDPDQPCNRRLTTNDQWTNGDRQTNTSL